jgi:hypothetical protein
MRLDAAKGNVRERHWLTQDQIRAVGREHSISKSQCIQERELEEAQFMQDLHILTLMVKPIKWGL